MASMSLQDIVASIGFVSALPATIQGPENKMAERWKGINVNNTKVRWESAFQMPLFAETTQHPWHFIILTCPEKVLRRLYG